MTIPRSDTEPLPPAVPRWIASVICILYGFAKLNGSQFTVLDSELGKPLGQVSGFWLTWYYFSYSATYGTVIALVQIVAGVLMIVPRTALLGAVMMLPVVANILMIDVFYGVDIGGTMAAAILAVCIACIVAPYGSRLRHALLLNASPGVPSKKAIAAIVLILASAYGFTWWIANVNNRSPTSIDGVWAVTSPSRANDSLPRWNTMFFERNRAMLVVFRSSTGAEEQHHFEVDSIGNVRIWKTWLAKGALLMTGRVVSDGTIEMESMRGNGINGLILRRVDESGSPRLRSGTRAP